ncbi:MAG: SGNH/GDSL hydrolase family protein, partial [Sphingobacterium sp.]
IICSLFCFCIFICQGQQINWESPLAKNAIQGRVETLTGKDKFNRLPEALDGVVRDAVWNLGRNSAGVYIDFQTQADSIFVRYKVSGSLNMPHMPSTGVSGLDLYVKNEKQKDWNWTHGKYSFKDTVNYSFQNIRSGNDRVFRLYLPLYNSVSWLEIGVKDGEKITYTSNKEKPIIIYGTSIAQGACATRPGLAWSGFLGREFTNPVINLGFSGNGRLEEPILDLISKEDPAVFILDCIPNLAVKDNHGKGGLAQLMIHAVKYLRKEHPTTPIIFAAHSSSDLPELLSVGTSEDYNSRSKVGKEVVNDLIAKGDKNLYWLSSEEMDMDINSTVDYAHPNDIGMQKIAKAYTKLIHDILGD